jgi:hypothetical protein
MDQAPQQHPSLDSIEISVPSRDSISKNADELTELEESSLASAEYAARIEAIKQDTTERKRYANRTFWLVCFWLGGIALTIVAQGFKAWGFYLDADIVMALIGGTTTGVVGIFLIVARYLFPSVRKK